MVAYNFKQQFAPLIRSGAKQQTIRARRKNRHAIAGEPIQIYTGMRTKSCSKLIDPDPICRAALPTSIDGMDVVIDGTPLVGNELEQFAIADGFSSFDELADFFKDRMPFEGVLIAWGDWQPYWTPF
ncbi:ASCH domain-containing protein [Leptothoe sp. LEGE 181152]|nr:ASCH domain-containing protein [Leptothoe sp. LEGE 181152]